MNKETKKPFIVLMVLVAVLAAWFIFGSRLVSTDPGKVNTAEVPDRTQVVQQTDNTQEETLLTVTEVKHDLQMVKELISMKYYYTNATEFSKVRHWAKVNFLDDLTKSTLYLTYDGVISLGIDLNDITIDIDNFHKVITIGLPEAKVLAHEIDTSSIKTNKKESILNKFKDEDVPNVLTELKSEQETKVLGDSEYMNGIREQTEKTITDFLSLIDNTKGYTINFQEVK